MNDFVSNLRKEIQEEVKRIMPQTKTPLRKKTIHCEIILYSGMNNYEVQEFIEQKIMSSVVNSSVWNGSVVSCKIIKDELIKPI